MLGPSSRESNYFLDAVLIDILDDPDSKLFLLLDDDMFLIFFFERWSGLSLLIGLHPLSDRSMTVEMAVQRISVLFYTVYGLFSQLLRPLHWT